MKKHEALEAAKNECFKANKKFRIEKCKASTHYKLFIDGVRRVLIVSDTCAISIVRNDVRKAIRGM